MSDRGLIQQFMTQQGCVGLDDSAIEALAGDASTRRYYRVKLADWMGKSQDSSWIVTIYPEPFVLQPFADRLRQLLDEAPDALLRLANDPLGQLEMTDFLARQGLPVPRVCGLDPALGIVAFSDFGDIRMSEALEGRQPAEVQALYAEAIQLLVRLQEASSQLDANSGSAMLRFSSAKFMWELDFFLEHYLHSYLGRTPDPTQLKAYRRCLTPLCDALEAMPPVLTHRDYHARNLMFFQDKLALIDYQDARPGPRTYDLVSLLLDPYAPTDRLDRNSLIEGYCNQRQVVLTDAFWLEWDQVATQRLLKAAGSFAFLVGVRKRREYEPYLRPTLERACACMRRLQNLEPIIELVDQTLDFIKA